MTMERDVFQAAARGVVVVAELEREFLRISGPDGATWLNGLVSCDLSRVDAAHGAYGLLLSKQGKIQSDVDVIVGASGLYVSLAPGTGANLHGTLDRHLVMEDAELSLDPTLALVRTVGDRSGEVLARIGDSTTAVLASGAVDWLGLGGAAFAVPRAELDGTIRRLLELGGPAALAATTAEWDALRISRAFPQFGRDYGTDDNPHEASLEKLAVSFSKGCYLGQEVVCMQDMRGKVKRRLISLKLPGGPVEAGSEVATEAGEPVGQVTSTASSGAATFALARVRSPHFDTSSALHVRGVPAERLSAS